MAYKDKTQAQYRREKYAADPAYRENLLAHSANWRKTNKQQWLAGARTSNATYKARLRSELFAAYGGVCACCGESSEEFLTLDHIGGGGAKERRSLGWQGLGTSFYLLLKKQGWPKDRYQLLCMNCNWATRHGKICPHQRGKLSLVEGLGC